MKDECLNYYLAVDIGASSGRHILGCVEDGRIRTREVYRFSNGAVKKNGRLCWDTEYLYKEILTGLERAGKDKNFPVSVGIDTWGVDFVLLDKEGKRLGEAVSYRDAWTMGMEEEVRRLIPDEELYKRTGIQKQSYNTIYQLMAVKKYQPQLLENAEALLMMPDYFHYLLTGIKKQEYTIASTTGLLNAAAGTWDRELIDILGLPQRLFYDKLAEPGERIGEFTEDTAKIVGYQSSVTLPASHDTASAFLAVPAEGRDSVFISSGTWSLLGVENETPITSEESRAANFTNEGGYGHQYRYLKNITGMWIVQNIRKEMAPDMEFSRIEASAKKALWFQGEIDVENPMFFAPANMCETIRSYCRVEGLYVPQTLGELVIVAYRGLASCYAARISELEKLTEKKYNCLHIVGGGSQAAWLNELIACRTGLPVYAGPSEGTALGSLMAQFIAGGEFQNLAEARKSLRESFSITLTKGEGWENGWKQNDRRVSGNRNTAGN